MFFYSKSSSSLAKLGTYITHNATALRRQYGRRFRGVTLVATSGILRSGKLTSFKLQTPRFFSFSNLYSSAPAEVTSLKK